MKKLIIVGGGASGLMAAAVAIKNNCKVIILEKKERIGSKILATGNGHCNFTNEYLDLDCYYNENQEFLSDSFKIFDNQSTIDFMNNMGVLTKEKNGYYYPYSMEASAVLNGFRTVLGSDLVTIITEINILDIKKDKAKWIVNTDKGAVSGDSLLISCGSNASYKKDYNSDIISFIKGFGHKFKELKPALTYLKVSDEHIKLAAGVRFPVNIQLYKADALVAEEKGEIQITSKGISGICVFQLSRYISRNQSKNYRCFIDFMPDIESDDLDAIIWQKSSIKNDMLIEELFNGILPKKLIIGLSKANGLSISKAVKNQPEALKAFIKSIKKYIVSINGTGDIFEAQCLTGGIYTNEVNSKTMESKLIDGLYFAGEILDIDGKCGGYNLQWAWTSGYIAGISASK